MKAAGYCVFETAIGTCGIAWTDARPPAVKHFHLLETKPGEASERLARRSGAKTGAPPAEVAALVERVKKHLSGDLQDFREVVVDLSESGEFDRMVLLAALRVPAGETTTYGDLAKAVGRPTEARAVGQVMARNPIPLIIPCHRVLAANGLGGFSAPGDRATKTKLLAIEKARFPAVFDFPE